MGNTVINEHFEVVYKTTVSIILLELMRIGFIALLGYAIFSVDVLWVQILLGFMIVALAVDCLRILKHTKERIVVTPHSLVLTNLYTKTKHGKWHTTKTVDIPWSIIADIAPNLEVFNSAGSFVPHKTTLVILRNGTLCCIEDDYYDVFFLTRKLKAFWKEFGKKK